MSTWDPFGYLAVLARLNQLGTQIGAFQNLMVKAMSALSDAVANVSAGLDALGLKLDTETTEIGKVLALLQQGNPDIPAAITALQGLQTRVGTMAGTVDEHISTLDAALPAPPPAP